MIHVFEQFKDCRGEKWSTIECDFLKSTTIDGKLYWNLNCDFRLPSFGVFYIPHPRENDQAIEVEYTTPDLDIPNYQMGVIWTNNFTEELRAQWEALPDEITFKIGRITLIAKKDIIDSLEHSVMGKFYIYRPMTIVF